MLNKIVLAGRVCKDPELKFGQSGKPFLKFLMAIEGRDKTTMWINCVVFNEKTIEIYKDRLVKGSSVAVTGRLDPRSYENKMYIDLNVDMFGLEVFGDKSADPKEGSGVDFSKRKTAAKAVDLTEIPF